nr:hypothetical protein [Tanacetum cinerariifolium]
MSLLNPQRNEVPAAVLTQSKLIPINVVRLVSTAVPKISVTRPRQAKTVVTKSKSPPRRHINRSPSPKPSNFPLKVTAVKALMVNDAKFCGMKEIKREFSVPRTPQQNGIAERKNRTLIETRVLVTKPHNKTPYELLHCRTPSIGSMRPFGCPVTILNTLYLLVKFDGKVDEGFLVRHYVSSKAYRVFNSRTRIVQETLHVNFLENKPNVAEKAGEDSDQQYVLFSVWSSGSTNHQNTDGDDAFDEKEPEFDEKKLEYEVNVSLSSSAQSKKHDDKTKREAKGKSLIESLTGYRNLSAEFEDFSNNIINKDNAASTLVPAVGILPPNNTNTFSAAELEDITYSDDEDDVGVVADFNNLETSITISPIPTTRVHKDHHVTQIIGHLSSATQTRSMIRVARDQGGLSQINNDDFHTFSRIKAIRLFLAYASFMGFMVYQMDVKSAFLYGTIEEEVYVCQPPGFEDPDYPDKV